MDQTSRSCASCGPWWRLPLLLAIVLIAIVLTRGRGLRDARSDLKDASPAAPAGAAMGETVSLEIDFGDGRRRKFEPTGWREGMTVLDLTREARRDDKMLDVRGSDASAFLASLDGVSNEGGEGRNWTYSVNGKWADRSFAIYELQPGDQVLWTFAAPR